MAMQTAVIALLLVAASVTYIDSKIVNWPNWKDDFEVTNATTEEESTTEYLTTTTEYYDPYNVTTLFTEEQTEVTKSEPLTTKNEYSSTTLDYTEQTNDTTWYVAWDTTTAGPVTTTTEYSNTTTEGKTLQKNGPIIENQLTGKWQRYLYDEIKNFHIHYY